MDKKVFKDPLYGYIEIPTDLVTNIIDTPSFQRLRRIIQTSYSPVYPSAIHNRFTHSLGVYHLGSIAIKSFLKKNTKFSPEFLKNSKSVFLLACLLHDVGHAPFSHTGEIFYLGKEKNYSHLHTLLKAVVDDKNFSGDVPTSVEESAAPHEIMSAIIGLKNFSKYFETAENRSFFARCITGYRYAINNEKCQILNCFISLLNSDVIDVDKLDYLIRDAYMTGFSTISIDYNRLLTSLKLVKAKSGEFILAYTKNAISVIENVVYARDSEKKWIQTHPVIQYESYLLQQSILKLTDELDLKKVSLFSYEALTEAGVTLANNIKVKLLCDDDIVCLLKNQSKNDIFSEFWDRRKRRHPIWKSESEYKTLFELKAKGEILDSFEKAMGLIAKYMRGSPDIVAINDKLIKRLDEELQKIVSIDSIDAETKKIQKQNKTEIVQILKKLKSCASINHISFDFIIIKEDQFISGFGKSDFSTIKIAFSFSDLEDDKIVDFGTIASSLLAKEKEKKPFYYLFYKKGDIESSINKDKLAKDLITAFM